MNAKSRTAIPRALERRLYQEVGSRCPVCDTADIASLSVHHIIRYSQLSEPYFEAMIVLCNNCHSKADRNEITPDQLFAIKSELNARRPTPKKASPAACNVVGAIAAGGDINISGGVVISQGNHRHKEAARPNTVSEDKWMVGYLDHLVKRFNEFKSAELKHRGEQMNHLLIRVSYEREMGFPVRHTPVEMFERATRYLQRRIDATLVGKRNTKKTISNYSEFLDWKTKKSGPNDRTAEELADLILSFVRETKRTHPDANAFEESLFCGEFNESHPKIAKAIDVLVARGRAAHTGLSGTWTIVV